MERIQTAAGSDTGRTFTEKIENGTYYKGNCCRARKEAHIPKRYLNGRLLLCRRSGQSFEDVRIQRLRKPVRNALQSSFGNKFPEQALLSLSFHAGGYNLYRAPQCTGPSLTAAQDFLDNANERLKNAAQFFKEADTVIMTLGTAWVFRHIPTGKIVSNCHKIDPGKFRREFLQTEEIFRLLENFITRYPDKEFILTVSPIRHLKDGAHGNNLSKAALLMSIDWLQRKGYGNVSYFPAYEIMLDELRDYRFYAEDMVHPSQQAVKYIFERFTESFIAPSEYEQMRLNLKRYKQAAHIPIKRE